MFNALMMLMTTTIKKINNNFFMSIFCLAYQSSILHYFFNVFLHFTELFNKSTLKNILVRNAGPVRNISHETNRILDF